MSNAIKFFDKSKDIIPTSVSIDRLGEVLVFRAGTMKLIAPLENFETHIDVEASDITQIRVPNTQRKKILTLSELIDVVRRGKGQYDYWVTRLPNDDTFMVYCIVGKNNLNRLTQGGNSREITTLLGSPVFDSTRFLHILEDEGYSKGLYYKSKLRKPQWVGFDDTGRLVKNYNDLSLGKKIPLLGDDTMPIKEKGGISGEPDKLDPDFINRPGVRDLLARWEEDERKGRGYSRIKSGVDFKIINTIDLLKPR